MATVSQGRSRKCTRYIINAAHRVHGMIHSAAGPAAPAPTPTITLLRHGQDEHNATGNVNLRDDALTPLGEHEAAEYGARCGKVYDLVVSSPLHRAVQTALLATTGPRPVVLLDGLMERQGQLPVCHRMPATVIAARFGGAVDISRLIPGDPPYPAHMESMGALVARAHAALHDVLAMAAHLHARHVLVVTHSEWIQALTGARHPIQNATGYDVHGNVVSC